MVSEPLKGNLMAGFFPGWRRGWFCMLLFAGAFVQAWLYAEAPGVPAAGELLLAADRARGAAASTGGVSWNIAVDSREDGRASKVHYRVRAKGDHALAEATEPPRNKGEMILLNDRRMWLYKSGLKKPMSISSRQKLMGQASNGDIASTRYQRDYEGKVVGAEEVSGRMAWKLELKARGKDVTYDRIRYWVSQDLRLGVKAEFLTVAGEVFKSAGFTYDNAITIEGKEYPFVSEMRIQDARTPSDVTSIHYDSPRVENHADGTFNVNNLLR